MSETDGATGLMQSTEQADAPAQTAGGAGAASLPDRIRALLGDALTAEAGEPAVVETAGEATEGATFLSTAGLGGDSPRVIRLTASGALASMLASSGAGGSLERFWDELRAFYAASYETPSGWNVEAPVTGTAETIAAALTAGGGAGDALLTVHGAVRSPAACEGRFTLVLSGTSGEVSAPAEPERDRAAAVFSALEPAGGTVATLGLGLVADIELELVARLGEVEMKLEEVLALSPGSVLELNRTVEEPVDLVVNGKHIGRADVVVVGERFGLRITEIGEKRIRRRG